MKVATEELRDLAIKLCPDLRNIICHESKLTVSTWKAGVETGKAIEFLAMCSLIASMRKVGVPVTIPDLFFKNPDLYYLRNVLPRHHGAQAGHEAAARSIPLIERFIAALTPKAIVNIKGVAGAFYREGFPVHLIEFLKAKQTDYQERPDILGVEGSLDTSITNEFELEFLYRSTYGSCSGALRIKNDFYIPLIQYESSLDGTIPTIAIVECSVGKHAVKANEQIAKYVSLFKGSYKQLYTVLINGQKPPAGGFDIEAHIDLSADGNELLIALERATDKLSQLLIRE